MIDTASFWFWFEVIFFFFAVYFLISNKHIDAIYDSWHDICIKHFAENDDFIEGIEKMSLEEFVEYSTNERIRQRMFGESWIDYRQKAYKEWKKSRGF